MNLTPKWIPFLAAAGYEAQFWSSVGSPTSADRTILRYAADHGFVVLTRDLDFGHMLARENQSRPSVIQVRPEHATPTSLGTYVLLVLTNCREELEQGALVTLDADKTRIRMLPFRSGS